MERTILCRDSGTELGHCVKNLGSWINDGNCTAIGDDITCGPGNQRQTRTCVDGSYEKCTDILTVRTTECSNAGTTLPDCIGTRQYLQEKYSISINIRIITARSI